MKIPEPLLPERYDVFDVSQVTRDTSLEQHVAVDLVKVEPGRASESHRHNRADTLLLILEGSGEVHIAGKPFHVSRNDRLHIPPGAYHHVITRDTALSFLSVQMPPILLKGQDKLDLETEVTEK